MTTPNLSGEVDPSKYFYPPRFYQEYELKHESGHVTASSIGLAGRVKNRIGLSKNEALFAEVFTEKGQELASAADELIKQRASGGWRLDPEMQSQLTELKEKLVRFVYNAGILGKVSGEGSKLYVQNINVKLNDIKDALKDLVTISFDDGSTLKVDIQLLKANFELFKHLMSYPFEESETGVIQLREISKAAFERSIAYLKSNELSEEYTEDRLDDYFVADHLGFNSYREAVFNDIKKAPDLLIDLITNAPHVYDSLPKNEKLPFILTLIDIIEKERDEQKRGDLTKGLINLINNNHIPLSYLGAVRVLDLLSNASPEVKATVKYFQIPGFGLNVYQLRRGIRILENCPHIEHVGISGPQVSDEHLQQLGELKLTSLSLFECIDITDAGLAHLAGMPLASLNLSCCWNLTDAGLVHLAGMPLTSLNLNACNITDAGLAHLAGMPLTSLNLSVCSDITDAGLAHLAGMPLTSLDLSGCSNITDAGLALLAEMPLTSLSLPACSDITSAGLAHLAGMPLTNLSLFECSDITDAGLAHLAGMPLSSLNLFCCTNLTDAGLAHLAGMPLTNLDLSWSSITDAGLAHLAGMPLTNLDLSECWITDEGLAHLAGMPLTNLDLSECRNITDAGLAQIRAQLPNAVIRR